MRFVCYCILCILGLCGGGHLYAAQIHVAAAANFRSVLDRIKKNFEAKSGHKLLISYGASGGLYSQIRHGAPFDVFLSADAGYPKALLKNGLGVPGSDFVYAIGQLVLWSPNPMILDKNTLTKNPRILSELKFKHLSLANPITAPYGAVAKEALLNLDIWASIQDRLVKGESVDQAFHFVATSNAELGLVALSQLIALPKSKDFRWLVPQEYYAPLKQSALLLRRTKELAAASAFAEYLKSNETRAMILSSGYRLD